MFIHIRKRRSRFAAPLLALPSPRMKSEPRLKGQPPTAPEVLFIKPLSTTTYACFPQFLQPGGALARGIDLRPATGNRPAPISPLETIHHASEIFAGGEIAAAQFPQRAYSGLSVVHRRDQPGAKQVTQFSCVHAIVLVALPEQNPSIVTNFRCFAIALRPRVMMP
jgi:hypothetical protein